MDDIPNSRGFIGFQKSGMYSYFGCGVTIRNGLLAESQIGLPVPAGIRTTESDKKCASCTAQVTLYVGIRVVNDTDTPLWKNGVSVMVRDS